MLSCRGSAAGGGTGATAPPGEKLNRRQKGEDRMRKYGQGGRLEKVICNGCGKKLVVDDGIVREGVLSIDHVWDYFSEKDGEIHHLDLCESCCDRLAGELRIPVEVEEQTELL